MGTNDLEPKTAGARRSNQGFVTTHWSVVIAAGNEDWREGTQALQTLCQTYWPPIYSFLRRSGHRPADAEDLTQDFFSHLLRKNLPERADPAKGRFRSFLLHTLKQFVADQQSKARAIKRGGGVQVVSLEVQAEENPGQCALADDLTPDRAFERRWIKVILDQVAARLEMEYVSTGRKELFDTLKSFQPGEQGETSYDSAADRLDMTLPAVKSAIHRLRRRHGELMRDEIAQTVASPAEIDDEVRYFLSCWS